MGHDEFQRKLAAAERTGTRDRYVDLMQYARKENIRAPRAILRVGNVLVTKHRRGLGDELWNIYEQTFLAALDGQDETVAEVRFSPCCGRCGLNVLVAVACPSLRLDPQMCLHELTRKFPRSARVARLRGMHLEHQGEWDEALTLYNELLEANGANTAVLKRKIAVLKAQGKTRDVVHALNDYLRLFGTDPAAVRVLHRPFFFFLTTCVDPSPGRGSGQS
ncbi:hypothetical protein PsorP6_003236 [Peronosclerospora sorghi]|uniref:Uncharacterized protein n=1 Tax=Peronosclerospora sorghi TaxID=230839 RepID=A0ACC0VJ62_9STRA|nr:hypothetical protein PsorP6_003236 [Peronosclerospora sorghi]